MTALAIVLIPPPLAEEGRKGGLPASPSADRRAVGFPLLHLPRKRGRNEGSGA
jgi:hypothetical protein